MASIAVDAQNPLGLNGFEFVEYCHPDPAELDRLDRSSGRDVQSRAVGSHEQNDHRGEQRLLVVEMPVKGGRGHARFGADGTEGRALDAVAVGSPAPGAAHHVNNDERLPVGA